MRYAPSILAAALALVACSDGLAPVTVGAPYLLRTVNGQPLPWSTPSSDSSFTPATITEGWVTLLDQTRAQRHERIGRVDSDAATISVLEADDVIDVRKAR